MVYLKAYLKYLIILQKTHLQRLLKTNLKTKPSIEYLGCSIQYFIEFLKRKMSDKMTLDNIQLDHIKPVSKFNLDNPDEFLDCVHYTNFQPLLASENLSKSNKWSDEDDFFWNENIKNRKYNEIYYPL